MVEIDPDAEAELSDGSLTFDVMENAAVGAPSGAGIQAAQSIVEQGADAVVTGNMGPNAFNVLQAAGVSIYLFDGGTVRQAVEAFRGGRLQSIADANAPAHAGMGPGMGMGRGMGAWSNVGAAIPQAPVPTSTSAEEQGEQDDVAALKETASLLRQQIADLLERLERLENE